MPLKRHSHKSQDSERKKLGRKLYTQAKAKSKKKTSAKSKKSDAEQASKKLPTEPSSGTFSPPPLFEFSIARTWRDAWVPMNATLVATEKKLSELYATKGIPDDARQIVLNLLVVVKKDRLLAGFSPTVTACAVAGFAGTVLGKTLLAKATIQELGVRAEAVQSAAKVLMTEKETLLPVIERFEMDSKPGAKGKRSFKFSWSAKPELKIRARWVAPGRSRLRDFMAYEDVTDVEQQEGLRAYAKAEMEREERMRKGQKFGGRPRRGRAASSAPGDRTAESTESVQPPESLDESSAVPQRSSSRKRKVSDK